MNEYDWEAKHYEKKQAIQRDIELARSAIADGKMPWDPDAPHQRSGDLGHLILVRNVSERIVIFAGSDRIVIQIDKANYGQATLSFVAPKSVRILREEILDATSGRDSSGDCQADR